MIEYSDFVSSINKEEEDKIGTAISTSWRALSGLSYGAGLKVITSTLDKVQIVFKETVIELVSEDDYDKALNSLIILNSATELFKASSAWQEEVYSKLLENKEENHEDTRPPIPTSQNTNFTSSIKPSSDQKRWAVLQAAALEVSRKQRSNVLNRAVLLMAECGWSVSSKAALRNVLAGLLTSTTPSLEYVNPEKAKYRGIQLTNYGQDLLQSLTHQLKP